MPSSLPPIDSIPIRDDWTAPEVMALFDRPLLDLVHQAQSTHRTHHEPNALQLSTLLNIRTGACAEDCAYCSQSRHHHTDLQPEPLLDVDAVVAAARQARDAGADRFCMGAAWRSPKDRDIPRLVEIVAGVKALGLETCLTAGMLSDTQVTALKESGLDFYNHNLDTSPEFYGQVITTRTYQDRLDTLRRVRDAGIAVCSGGILGMGEARRDRAGLLVELANLPRHPESVPINLLVPIPGTPLEDAEPLDPFEVVRTIAVARLLMPTSVIRLSAGREAMSDELQALCFMAGANSVFYGDRLLTTDNADTARDRDLFRRLGLHPRGEPAAPPA